MQTSQSITDSLSQQLVLTNPPSGVQSVEVGDAANASGEEPNMALAPEEIATLSSLMNRYDQLLLDVDRLSQELEALLKSESPPPTPPAQ